MMTGVMAAVPMPAIKRADSINIREFASADRMLPRVNTMIPDISVIFRPITSPTFPKIGAKAAVDMA